MKYFPRAVPVPFALHYTEKSALGAVCRALCCCIYVEGDSIPVSHPILQTLTALKSASAELETSVNLLTCIPIELAS
jgi:hypothetical protein